MISDEIKNYIKKEKIDALGKVDTSINKRINHFKPSSDTLDFMSKIETQIELIKNNYSNMVDRINQMIVENKEQHKEMMEELKCTTSEINRSIFQKADKMELDRLEGFVSKVMWISITSVIGFLISLVVTTGWYLVGKL